MARSDKVATTLINRSSFQVFNASLYEAATEEVTRETVLIPLAEIFDGTSVESVRGELVSVDKAERRVYLKNGDHYDYDYLVLAVGAESSDFGIPGVKEYAFSFRDFKETIMLRDQFRTAFHLAKERGKNEVRIVVCGGGFSGVELAAELRHHLGKLAHEYLVPKVKINILEAGPQIMPGLSGSIPAMVAKRLKELNIDISLGDPVGEVKADGVRLKSDKFIPSDITIWTAGTKANPLPAEMGLPLDQKGRPVVNETMNVLGYQEIFAAGDIAGFLDPRTGKPIPPQAYYAIEMGSLVGQNILRSIEKVPLRKLVQSSIKYIIPIGHNQAIAYLWGLTITGVLASLLRVLIEFRYLVSLFGPIKAWPIFWAEVKVMAD